MTRTIRRFFWGLFTGSLLVLILVYAIISLTDLPARGINRFINQAIPAEMKMKLSIGRVRGDLFNGLRFYDVSVYSLRDKTRTQTVRIAEARVRYHLTDLLGGRYLFSEIILIQPSGQIDGTVLTSLRGDRQANASVPPRKKKGRSFGVDHLIIQDGLFTYRSSGTQTCTFQDIFLKGGFEGDGLSIRGNVQEARVYWREKDLRVETLEVMAGLTGDSLSVDRLFLKTVNSTLTGTGTLVNLSDPRFTWKLEKSVIYFPELERGVGVAEETVRGTVFLDAAISGPLDDLSVKASLSGSFNEYAFDSLNVDFHRNHSLLEWNRFDLVMGDTRLAGSGDLSLKTGPTYRAALSFEGFDLVRIQGVTPRSDLRGNISIEGEGFCRETLRLDAEFQIDKGSLDRYPIDGCNGRVRLTGDGLSTIGPLLVQSTGSTASIEGKILFAGGIDVVNRIDSGDLSAAMALFNLPRFEGRAQADVRISGKMSNPAVEGTVRIEDLSLGSLSFAECRSVVRVENLFRGASGSARIKGTEGKIGTVSITEADGTVSLDGTVIRIDSLTALNTEVVLHTAGVLDMAGRSKTLSLSQVESSFREYRLANTDTISLSFCDDGGFSGKGSFTTENGGFDFSGSLRPDGRVETELIMKSIDLAPIIETLHSTGTVMGVVDGTIGLSGRLEDPFCDLHLWISNGSVTTIDFDTLVCAATLDRDLVALSDFRIVQRGKTVFECNGTIPARLDFTGETLFEVLPAEDVDVAVRMTDFSLQPISRLVASSRPFDGLCRVNLTITGTPADPKISMTCSIREARYDMLQVGDIQGRFEYGSGHLRVQNFESSYQGTEYASTGVIPLNISWPPTGSYSTGENIEIIVGLAGDIPSGLIPLLTDRVRHIQGDMDARFSLSGELTHPILNGDLTVQGGTILLADLENPITDMQVRMTVNDTILTIQRIEGKMGKEAVERDTFLQSFFRILTFRKKDPPGHVVLAGTITFADMDRLVFDLDLTGQKLFLRPMRQNIDLVADAEIRMTGVKYPQVTGTVLVTQGLVKDAFKPRDQVQSPAPSDGARGPGAGLDLTVHIPGNFWVEGSDYLQELSVELRGDIQLLKQMSAPELQFFGAAETMRGKYHIYGNPFRITQGTISFGGIPEFNPTLDIEAETLVGSENVSLNLSGTLLQPEVRLWSQSGYSEKDIIALLTLGTTSAAVDTVGVSGAFESKATNVLGSLIEGELARRARRQLGVDTFEISGSGGTQLDPTETQLTVGKYLSDRIYIEYSRRLATESEQEIELEYRLNRHFSFLGTQDRRGLYHLQLQLKTDY